MNQEQNPFEAFVSFYQDNNNNSLFKTMMEYHLNNSEEERSK